MRTTGIVLAGGAGERLGTVFKPALRIHGRRLLDTILTALEPQVARTVLSTGTTDPQRFAPWRSHPQVPDDPRLPIRGPAAGLLSTIAALDLPDEALVLTVPGDSPTIPADLADRLAANLVSGTDVCMARAAGQLYPTHALWRVSALHDRLRQAGEKQGKSPGLRHLLPGERTGFADWEGPEAIQAFATLNDLADLVQITRKSGISG